MKKPLEIPFEKRNYLLLALSAAVVLIGFILMSGGGSDDPEVFNPEIFSFQRISLAPTVVIAGYVLGVFAIMYPPKSKE